MNIKRHWGIKSEKNFVMVDLTRKEDETLIIMEFGDGQVSGLQQIEAETFYRRFRSQSGIKNEEEKNK